MQNRYRRITVYLFGVVAGLALAFDIYLSLDPERYFFYWPEDRAKWLYDFRPVAVYCAIMLAEGAIACAAIVARRPQFLWLRSLLGLAVLVPWAWYSTMFVVHMPFYILFHHVWVWLLVLCLAAVFVVSVVTQVAIGKWRKARSVN
jgi:hypothetical protein